MESKCLREDCHNEVATGPGRTGKYCSRSCAAIVNNARFPKRVRTTYDNTCVRCLTKFMAGVIRPFCSRECFDKHRGEEYIRRWAAGEETGSYESGELSRVVRDYLLDQAGDKCTKCGWCEVNPFLGKVILTVDHVDGDWSNNSIDNLVVLCYNCHTLTPTFGSLNKGNSPKGRSIGSRRH